jgi:CHAD domain-containing protein
MTAPGREKLFMHLDPRLLDRSPQEAVRHVCLHLLSEADLALARFENDGDAEALHDFRVGVRRLRSLARAYRPYLKGSIRKKHRRRLGELASATNAARDLHVQMDWLSEQAARLDAQAAAGAEELLRRLESRAGAPFDAEKLRREFDSLHASLKKSLTRMRLALPPGSESFLAAASEVVRGAGEALRNDLDAIRSVEDTETLHLARLTAKRLRYVLEPLLDVRGVRSLIKRMKSLQDVLGELQDVHVLAVTISEELEKAALEQAHHVRDLALESVSSTEPVRLPPLHPSLLALLAAQRDRRAQRYRTLESEWLVGRAASFFRDVDTLAERLAMLGSSNVRRRRFLLSELPEEAKRVEPGLVREGFLPGRRIRESVRSIQAGGRTRYVRRVEAAGAPAIEETLARAEFERLWPLTEGRRTERVRYDLRSAGQLWHVDSIPERQIVIAEVEAGAEIAVPEWLAPVVRQEVTGRRKFAPESLAGDTSERPRSAPERAAGPRAEAQ